MKLTDHKQLQALKDGPTYRFWGKTPPAADRKKPAILASAPDAAIDENGAVVLRLYDPIDSWGGPWGVSAKEFVEVLDQLPDDVSEIRLHINSPGGEVFEAFAILNALRRHDATVTAVVDGLAASAASFIATGADKTIMARNSQLMIHDAWGICIGNAADMHSFGDLLGHLSDNVAQVYADKSGGSVEDWRAAMVAETWYSPQEAVDAKLADEVEGAAPAAEPADDEDDDEPQDAFDLTRFVYAGRDKAPAPGEARDLKAAHDERVRRFQQKRHAANAAKATA